MRCCLTSLISLFLCCLSSQQSTVSHTNSLHGPHNHQSSTTGGDHTSNTHHAQKDDNTNELFQKSYLGDSNINIQLNGDDESLIKRLASENTGTLLEAKGRKVVSVIYIKNAGSIEMLDLFTNFAESAKRNAPEFVKRKLIVVALDDSCYNLARSLTLPNIIRVYNGSTSMSSTFKFRLIHTILSLDTSVLLMEADQVVLKNPLTGLTGDADIEVASDYARPSLAFNDVYALDKPVDQAIREIADSTNIGLILFSQSIQSAMMIRTMIETEASVLTSSRAFVWDQKRFNLLLHGYLMYPSQVCYADGIIKGGIFTKGSKCIRNGLHLLVRLLPIELYPLGPLFMWGKLHCEVPGRDSKYMEQYSTLKMPLCGSTDETKNVMVVHAAGLLDVSKIYFFRDRYLWFVNETDRMQNRIILSSKTTESTLYGEVLSLVQQIMWSIAIEGEVVLPRFDCSYIKGGGGEVWKMESMDRDGKCPIDMFLKLSSIGKLLGDIIEESEQFTNRTWNELQRRQRMYNGIPFVEHSMIQAANANITDSRLLPLTKGQEWLKEIWGKRLITVTIEDNFNETLSISARWHDDLNPSFSFLSDNKQKLAEFINVLRQNKNRHIQFTGFTEQTNDVMMRSLKDFTNNGFQSYDETCAKIKSALFCNPWQIFFDKFPIYYSGARWNIDAGKAESCGFSSVC